MRAVVLAGVDLDAEVVAGAERVFLLDAENDSASFSALEKPAPSCRLPVGFSVTVIVQVDLVGRAGHVLRLDVHFLEEAEPVDRGRATA